MMDQLLATFKAAFNDCKCTTCECENKTAYEIVSYGTFFIYDEPNEQPVQIGQEGVYQLLVRNQNKKGVCVIKVDKCLFTDEHKKCDCILFNNDSFFLVEIKDAKNKQKSRCIAITQLASTLDILKENSVNCTKYNAKAVICFRLPKTRPIQTSFNTQRAIFFSTYKVDLFEGNEVVF